MKKNISFFSTGVALGLATSNIWWFVAIASLLVSLDLIINENK